MNNANNTPLTGDDGELLVADTSVKPSAPYVKPSPISLELREHLAQWGCFYLFLLPIVILFVIYAIADIQSAVMTLIICLVGIIAIIVRMPWDSGRR